MALSGQHAKLQLIGSSTSMSNESMSDIGNGTVWYIDADAKFVFDPDTALTVEVDSGSGFATVPASDYTVRYLIGAVEFDSDQSGNSVRISGAYLPRHTVAEVTSSDRSFDAGAEETPQYQDDAVRRMTTVQELTVDLTSWLAVENEIDAPTDAEGSLIEYLLGEEIGSGETGSIGRDQVLVFDKDGVTTEREAAFGELNSSDRSASPDSPQEHNLTFESTERGSVMATQSTRVWDRLEP